MVSEDKPSEFSGGQLETMFPWTERLPLVDVSPDTMKVFAEWGVSPENIARLRDLVSSFRYDLVEEKIKRMARLPLILSVDEQGNELVTIRHFFDIHGRMDGQCSDIASQFILMLHTTGLLDDMNADLARKEELEQQQNPDTVLYRTEIVPCLLTGLAETHFCQPDQNHVFNCLARRYAETEAKEIIDFVVVDAALQVIRNKRESRYVYQENTVNPRGLEKHSHSVSSRMGTITTLDDGVTRFSLPDGPLILGMSNDWKWAYSLAFARSKSTGSIVPILFRVHADGIQHDSFNLDPFDPSITQMSEGASQNVSYPEYYEITKILHEVRKITFAEVHGQLPDDFDLKHNTYFQ